MSSSYYYVEHNDLWKQVPDSILLQIFYYLPVNSLVLVSEVCQKWNRISQDEFLWKKRFLIDWNIEKSLSLAPKKSSWKSEYVRLSYESPSHLSDTLHHGNQVLHVAFSHDGKSLSTCSKDCFVVLWEVGYSTEAKHRALMSDVGWSYTQFSEFNKSDSLLLVSGVFSGNFTTSGEIIVFNILDGFSMQCRVSNKPYDVFGTWYNENYLLAGNLYHLHNLDSCSTVLLNKAWQETDSEHKPVLKRLFKFQNKCASSIRSIQVSKCIIPLKEEPKKCKDQPAAVSNKSSSNNESISTLALVNGNSNSLAETIEMSEVSNSSTKTIEAAEVPTVSAAKLHDENESNSDIIPAEVHEDSSHHDSEFNKSEKDINSGESEEPVDTCSESSSASDNLSDSDDNDHYVTYYTPPDKSEIFSISDSDLDEHDGILDPETKLLIFTTGSKTYTPHQVGFKIIKPFKFPETIKSALTLKALQKLREDSDNNLRNNPENIEDYFDKIDHIIDFNGHIIGMAVSPDERYLYVNCRPWPEAAVIDDPLCPPPIAEQIFVYVIDLMTLKKVDTVLRSHKAFTPNNDCFFIFLAVSDQYVGSGAEDKRGYLWDRHYGILLNKFEHADVVNCVAFNPRDPEMFVTVSDDCSVKIWRSKRMMKNLENEL